MLNAIKAKILGVLILFCAIATIKIADDNFAVAALVAVLAMTGMIYLKYKSIKASLPNAINTTMVKNGVMSIVWGAVFFIAPTYFLYEDYLFAYKSNNYQVTITKSTEMICSFGKRKSSSRTEEPCWDTEYQIEGKTFERRMWKQAKKGDKFNVVYVPNWNDGIRYEEPIKDRNAYFIKQISFIQLFFYILSLYKIITGILSISLSKSAAGSLIQNSKSIIGGAATISENKKEPTLD